MNWDDYIRNLSEDEIVKLINSYMLLIDKLNSLRGKPKPPTDLYCSKCGGLLLPIDFGFRCFGCYKQYTVNENGEMNEHP